MVTMHPFLNGIANPILHRKQLPSSPPEFLDEVFVPQVGDVVPNFRSGHAKARSKRDPDPIKQLIDDSISIIGKDISVLPFRIGGVVVI